MATIYRETTATGPADITGARGATFLKRVSWGAIFAGTVVALVLMLVLNLLGLGIGLGVVSPVTDENPLGTFGVGTGIWFGISSLISLFCGGWVAARLAGYPIKLNGALHGLVTWGMVTLFSFWIMTTTLGVLVSGVGSVVGRGMQMLTSGTQSPQITAQITRELQQRGISPGAVTGEPGAPSPEAAAPSPEEARTTADRVMGTISTAAISAFIALVLGGICAMLGGMLGAPPAGFPKAEEMKREFKEAA